MPKRKPVEVATAKLTAVQQLIVARKAISAAQEHAEELSNKELQRLNAKVKVAAAERELYLRELKRGE